MQTRFFTHPPGSPFGPDAFIGRLIGCVLQRRLRYLQTFARSLSAAYSLAAHRLDGISLYYSTRENGLIYFDNFSGFSYCFLLSRRIELVGSILIAEVNHDELAGATRLEEELAILVQWK